MNTRTRGYLITILASIACLQPISATFFSFLLVGTHFTLVDIAGMALILAGVILSVSRILFPQSN